MDLWLEGGVKMGEQEGQLIRSTSSGAPEPNSEVERATTRDLQLVLLTFTQDAAHASPDRI